jgi:hypothetical protein
VPVISRFYGIIIRMFFRDHAPAHFHAEYGEHELIVGLPHRDPERRGAVAGTIDGAGMDRPAPAGAAGELAAVPARRAARARRTTGVRGSTVMATTVALFHRLMQVSTAPGHVLRLTFADGETHDVDLAPLVRRGGVFAGLRDETRFAEARVSERGRAVEWPGDVDLCADALWLAAHGEHDLAGE